MHSTRPLPRPLSSGNPAALTALLADPKLPAALKDQLGSIPRAALCQSAGGEGNPCRASGRAWTRRRRRSSRRPTAGRAHEDQGRLRRTAVTLTTGVNGALKKAFTDAVLRVYFWGMFVILAGFIVTVFLPELALRKTQGQGAMAAEGVPPSEAVVEAAGAGHNGESE